MSEGKEEKRQARVMPLGHPADYPIGSLESRLAARAMAEANKPQKFRAPNAEDLKKFHDLHRAHLRMKNMFDMPMSEACINDTCAACAGIPPKMVSIEDDALRGRMAEAIAKSRQRNAEMEEKYGWDWRKREDDRLRELWFFKHPERRAAWEQQEREHEKWRSGSVNSYAAPSVASSALSHPVPVEVAQPVQAVNPERMQALGRGDDIPQFGTVHNGGSWPWS